MEGAGSFGIHFLCSGD